MARITIEDCIEQVPNRFHLVQMASIRAKQLKKGANTLVQSEENKEVVVALREIAAGFVTPDMSSMNGQPDEAPDFMSELSDAASADAAPEEGTPASVEATPDAAPEEES